MTALSDRPGGPGVDGRATHATRHHSGHRAQGWTAHLAPIGLEELVETAALLTRVDRKYVVPEQELPDLLAAVPERTRVLEIEGSRAFGYRSDYLDTPALDAFWLAGQGRRRRFKVRERTYLDTGTTYLEVKVPGPRGTNLKERVLRAHRGPLDDGEQQFLDERLRAARVPDHVRVEGLAPALVSSYRRTTLLLAGDEPGTDSRATLDTDLVWALPGAHASRLPVTDRVVVETKTGSTPSALDRLLWARGHRPVRISKFGTGLAALDPALPRLRWHRVLERDLGLPRR
ncbi:polyphosphate polymerase domain-containing protein [Nocardioides bruguierae]|uniref:Polyphosphate polymerase domain-containing protein n=1 Tax=Nocardioides bruguierae TaxID=2945102 RepID=A0A9X2D8B6_9ACTN|nr:polyphosphate polymerase domain-containing protein [Nocardioides bruguierae]MCM0620642.1 polyphosphate polymerase domain-containing protein [Nocardioides bruguierae]